MSNLSFVRHKGDGVTNQFALSVAGENIGYFRISDIHGYVDDKEVPITIDPNSPHIVRFTETPKLNADILIRRQMPVKKTYADFERGNNFGHRQVNNTFVQQLYLTQELLDGFFPSGFYFKQDVDLGGHKITNLGDATDDSDAVNKTVTDGLDSRLKSLENSVSGTSRFLPWSYNAVGGEDTLNPPYKFESARVFINGVRQRAGESFEIVDLTIMLAEPLEEDDWVDVELGTEPLDIGGADVVALNVHNLQTRENPIAWRSGLVVKDILQLYTYEGLEYLPSADKVPFTTGSMFDPSQWVKSAVLTTGRFISLIGATPLSELGAKPIKGFDNGSIIQDALDRGGYYYFDKLGVYESSTKLWMRKDRCGLDLNGSTIKSTMPPVKPPMTQGQMRDESIFFKIGEGNYDNLYQITDPILINGVIDANGFGVAVGCRTANRANIRRMQFKSSQGVGLDYQNSDNGVLHDLDFIDCAPDPSLAWSEAETEAYGDGMHVWIGSQSNDIKRIRIINTRQSVSSRKVARCGFVFEGQGNQGKETKNNTAELVYVRGYDRAGHTELCGVNNTFISPDFLVNESVDKKTFGTAFIAWGNKDVQNIRGGSILADSIALKLTGNKRQIIFDGTTIQTIRGLFMSNSEYVNQQDAYNKEVSFNSCFISFGGGAAQWFGGRYVFNNCTLQQSPDDKSPNEIYKSEFIMNQGVLDGVILNSQYSLGDGDVSIEFNDITMSGYKQSDSSPSMSLGIMNGGGSYHLNNIKAAKGQSKEDLRFVLVNKDINITSRTSFRSLPYSVFGGDQTRGYMCNGEFWAYDNVTNTPPPRQLEVGTRVNAISASSVGDITQWVCTAPNKYMVTQKIIS